MHEILEQFDSSAEGLFSAGHPEACWNQFLAAYRKSVSVSEGEWTPAEHPNEVS